MGHTDIGHCRINVKVMVGWDTYIEGIVEST